MAGRAQAFSAPTVIALIAQHFVPVAENCSPLQGQQDAKGAFFRLVAEQGHYAGRTFPTSTRQGYYAFTPDGIVLAAHNARDPERMAQSLQTALHRWHLLNRQDGGAARGADGHPPAEAIPAYLPARPSRYPEGGLVLRLAARDLPREQDTRPDDWRKSAWNLDYAWFTPDEARALVPENRQVGSRTQAPYKVVRRLARFHLRDFVRGEPSAWPEDAIRTGELSSEVVSVDGDEVRLALRGRITLHHTARWVRPEDGEARGYDTGFDATLAGDALWDAAEGRFVAFDLLAAGPRWGANQYNNRSDDLGPAPLAVAFTLAGEEPRDRTPPHQIWHRDYFSHQQHGGLGDPGRSHLGPSRRRPAASTTERPLAGTT